MPQTEVYEKKEHPDDTGLVEWIPYGMWLAICYLWVVIMTLTSFCERVNPLDPTDDQFGSIQKKGAKTKAVMVHRHSRRMRTDTTTPIASTDFIRGTYTTIEEDTSFTTAPVVLTQKRVSVGGDELEEEEQDDSEVGHALGEEQDYDSEVGHDSGECEFSAECAVCRKNGDCTSQSEFGNQGQYHIIDILTSNKIFFIDLYFRF